jgi:hypothetical protein
MRSHLIALTALSLGFAGAALAQQEQASPASSAPAASRAEVRADLEMWHRAGLTYLGDRETGYLSAEYLQGLERYRQLRNSPAYREAVARYAIQEQPAR